MYLYTLNPSRPCRAGRSAHGPHRRERDPRVRERRAYSGPDFRMERFNEFEAPQFAALLDLRMPFQGSKLPDGTLVRESHTHLACGTCPGPEPGDLMSISLKCAKPETITISSCVVYDGRTAILTSTTSLQALAVLSLYKILLLSLSLHFHIYIYMHIVCVCIYIYIYICTMCI